MENRIDLLLDNNDIVISNGDFVFSMSDYQHITDTINACPGWWKESYSEGATIIKYLKGRGIQQELCRAIKLNLQSDGYDSNPTANYDQNGNLILNTNVTI